MTARRSPSRLVGPAWLVLVMIFMAAPIVMVVVNSFNVSQFNAWPPPGWTLDWYVKALTYQPFIKGFWNSLVTASISTACALLMGVMTAYALARSSGHFNSLLRGAIFGPMIVPRVALGFSLFVLFLLSRLPLHGTYLGIVVAHCILSLPFAVAILGANLGEIDPVTEEAARDLGASPARVFFLAVWPQMRTGVLAAAAFVFLTSFDEVELTLFVTRPATSTLPVEMYHYLDQYQDPMIAAVSTLLILLTLVVIVATMLRISAGNLVKYLGSGNG